MKVMVDLLVQPAYMSSGGVVDMDAPQIWAQFCGRSVSFSETEV